MALIQPRGKIQNKRIQFTAPADIVDEFTAKKELLAKHNITVNLADDFIKVLKSAIKDMEKWIIEIDQKKEIG